jgi:Fe-S-cluster-containing dehydrogenase component
MGERVMHSTTFKTDQEFFVDPQRCIGCHACELACAECETNGQLPMISVDYVNRPLSTQTSVQICMHCVDPACAKVCPSDAITKDEFGVVHSANPARCIACSNCVLACPFGVPKMFDPMKLMMKCNLCYDRTSAGRKPMCATVCPSGALWYGTRAEMARQRPASTPVNTFQFGGQTVTTKVNVMMPKGSTVLVVD